ncbi:hypothetical protein K488DRAFT_75338, partial [Vararia minispora EC-137]
MARPYPRIVTTRTKPNSRMSASASAKGTTAALHAFATASSTPVTRKRLNSQASGVNGALEIIPGPPKKRLSTGSTGQHTSNDTVNEFDDSGQGEEDAVSEDEPAGDGGSKNIGADS